MQRLHLAKNDLDWLPKGYARLRKAVMGGVFSALGGGIATLIAVTHGHGFIYMGAKGVMLIGAAGYWAGDRASKALVTARLGKLASGDVDLARLSNSDDGELVHLRGTIRAQQTIPSTVGDSPGVYRRIRMVFGVDLPAIEEVGVDFQLVDGEGNAIGIEVERARWVVHDKKAKSSTSDYVRFEALPQVEKYIVRTRGNGQRMSLWRRSYNDSVKMSELMLRDGDELEVVGYKSRVVDPTMADRLMRDTPMRATLRGGKDLPLILSRVEKTT